ncbi:MAG: hypothetical protein LBH35_01660, partial [Treponema sp.]|nr:hypothetical protein [Treponema sp.]
PVPTRSIKTLARLLFHYPHNWSPVLLHCHSITYLFHAVNNFQGYFHKTGNIKRKPLVFGLHNHYYREAA